MLLTVKHVIRLMEKDYLEHFLLLKGSPIVTGDNLELYIDIIMNGYDARPEYGAMAAIGTNLGWTAQEVAAIINYERTSWGNEAPTVTVEEVNKILDFIKLKIAAQ